MNDAPLLFCIYVLFLYLRFVFVCGVMSDKILSWRPRHFPHTAMCSFRAAIFHRLSHNGFIYHGSRGGRACLWTPTADWPDIVYTYVPTHIGRHTNCIKGGAECAPPSTLLISLTTANKAQRGDGRKGRNGVSVVCHDAHPILFPAPSCTGYNSLQDRFACKLQWPLTRDLNFLLSLNFWLRVLCDIKWFYVRLHPSARMITM